MDLKQLKQLWRDEGFRPKKRLGQNFLIDKNVRDNILKEIPLTGKSVVVEIGAGFGVMSFTLADMCERLIAVEKDKKVCEIMTPLLESKGNVEVICDDILNVDLSSLTKGSGRVIVFGNIPYYISTPVIIRMIEQRECIDSVYIVIQEELADRIVSPPGSKIYGSISCFIQFYTKPEKLIRIKKNSFYPRPQVDSSLLKLEMLKKPSVSVKDKDLMFKIIRTAFSERRKKAINPLSGGKFPGFQREDWKRIFEECGIDPSSRAETLSLADYARLTDIIYNNK